MDTHNRPKVVKGLNGKSNHDRQYKKALTIHSETTTWKDNKKHRNKERNRKQKKNREKKQKEREQESNEETRV